MDELYSAASLAALAALPNDRSVSLLIRHSQRVDILDPANVYVAGLTAEGTAAAVDFGSKLAQIRRLRRIVSSPVSRCVDTAVAIACGAGWKQFVQVDDRISHPFLRPVWQSLPFIHYPDSPLPAELASLLKFIFTASASDAAIDVFVTHDTVVGSLAGYVTGQPVNNGSMPNYLEGVYLWEENQAYTVLWRGITTSFHQS